MAGPTPTATASGHAARSAAPIAGVPAASSDAVADGVMRRGRKAVVGGAGTAVDYKPAERAFHPRDVPPAAVAARLEVKTALAAATNPRAWNPSTLVTSACERRSTELRAFDRPVYRFNSRAEWLPPARAVETDVWGRITRLVPDEVSGQVACGL